ncbi:MAG: VOC family protein [Deltaproteobacteria bacterium]|nr:VOC family protein [Deltaproteobacteria bacterium]
MESRITIITLGVTDFQRSYHFYTELGFKTDAKPTDHIAFFKTSGTVLAIYPLDKLAEDISPDISIEKSAFSGITLAHNVKQKNDVNAVLIQAQEAGGRIVKPAQDAFWGGYHGYFSDPDGYFWEVAYFDQFKYDENGNLVL